MKKKLLLLIIILLISAVACGSDDGTVIPTRAEPVDTNATPTTDESPRIGPDSGLPPTWTPVPTSAPATPEVAGEEGTAGGNTEGQETYTVQPGDTLAEIAVAYGVSMAALVEANNIENIDVIEVNQVLIIPR